LKKQDVGKYIAIVGVLLLFTLPLGVVSTFYSIFLLFNEVQINGTGDPKLMAGGLSSALVSTVQGLILCVPGLFLLLISITALRYRPKWAYWVTVVYSILLLFMFPIGSILGIAGLITIILKRHSFGSDVNVT
jgi:hypothetical protein